VAELRTVNGAGSERTLTLLVAAELAGDHPGGIHVDLLAD
jgi:hypothetical protein